MSDNYRKNVGKEGEDRVVEYLKRQGFTICAQNYSCRYGEIDIIAVRKDILACVEVKTRNSAHHIMHGIISLSKQQKIIKTAAHYINTLSRSYVVRCDVAFVVKDSIEYIENAFTSEISPTF